MTKAPPHVRDTLAEFRRQANAIEVDVAVSAAKVRRKVSSSIYTVLIFLIGMYVGNMKPSANTLNRLAGEEVAFIHAKSHTLRPLFVARGWRLEEFIETFDWLCSFPVAE